MGLVRGAFPWGSECPLKFIELAQGDWRPLGGLS